MADSPHTPAAGPLPSSHVADETCHKLHDQPNIHLSCFSTIQYNTWLVQCPAYNEMERLGITILINDKSQLKRNVEQTGFQFALKTSKSLS